MTEQQARERVTLGINTLDKKETKRQIAVAKDIGAISVKFGYQAFTELSPRRCSKLAAKYGLRYIVDLKFPDTPDTNFDSVKHIANFDYPPDAITAHMMQIPQSKRRDTLGALQSAAGATKILGISVLTTTTEAECRELYGMSVIEKVMEYAHYAVAAGMGGLVCSAEESSLVKEIPQTKGLFVMTPGIRSAGIPTHDQERVVTPAKAITNRSDLLVVSRQVFEAADPALAYESLINEISLAA